MLTYTRVLEIIENGKWNDLIGQVEGDSFDGKREIYDLSSDHKKMELAKDVSSFANAAGGVIIVRFSGHRERRFRCNVNTHSGVT